MKNIKLEYNVPIEVTKSQQDVIKRMGAGLVAHGEENGKFWIRPLIMKFKEPIEEIENFLNRKS